MTFGLLGRDIGGLMSRYIRSSSTLKFVSQVMPRQASKKRESACYLLGRRYPLGGSCSCVIRAVANMDWNNIQVREARCGIVALALTLLLPLSNGCIYLCVMRRACQTEPPIRILLDLVSNSNKKPNALSNGQTRIRLHTESSFLFESIECSSAASTDRYRLVYWPLCLGLACHPAIIAWTPQCSRQRSRRPLRQVLVQ